MSKYSFHNVCRISNKIVAYVMDDYGYLVLIHHGRVNHFIMPLH